ARNLGVLWRGTLGHFKFCGWLTFLCAAQPLPVFSTEDISSPAGGLELLSVKKIWHGDKHNAFTDLIRFQDKWLCCFRESQAHVGGNGIIRVLASENGEKWESFAAISETGVDLRDPKLSIAPDKRLMLSLGGSIYEGKTFKERQSRVAFSKNGKYWTEPERVLKKGDWLWRVTWQKGTGYGIAYTSGDASTTQTSRHAGMTAKLVATEDGIHYKLVTNLEISGSPNEATLRFLENGDCVALVRREMEDQKAWIGHSSAPYREWQWHSAGMRVGGPNFIVLPDGAMVASGRKSSAGKPAETRTFVGRMDLRSVRPDLVLPSGGDSSYPGMVWENGKLWISYYSSHEGATDIYLAKVAIKAPPQR
ncbi:MAG TPA: hypothetical protein VFA77_05525, partial [Candidatus Eisenbacteria bacterium]|nr:hypothetical protein [Candidatus Eisenbacteria bacterium]